MPLCYLYFSFIFDKTYAQKNMKTKLIEKAKQISTEYKFGDFFRNFLAVILGIIITFAGSDWITEHNTQEEIKKSLQLVNSELLLNRDEIKAMGERVELEQHAANYLFENKNNANSLLQDSVYKYLPPLFQWSKFTFTSDAMEMLKTSGLIQKIQDKELALQIIQAYGTIKAAEASFDIYTKYKNQVQEEFNNNPNVKAFSYNQMKKKEKTKDFRDTLEGQLRLLLTQQEGLQLLQTIPNIQPSRIYFTYIEEIDKTIIAIGKECE